MEASVRVDKRTWAARCSESVTFSTQVLQGAAANVQSALTVRHQSWLLTQDVSVMLLVSWLFLNQSAPAGGVAFASCFAGILIVSGYYRSVALRLPAERLACLLRASVWMGLFGLVFLTPALIAFALAWVCNTLALALVCIVQSKYLRRERRLPVFLVGSSALMRKAKELVESCPDVPGHIVASEPHLNGEAERRLTNLIDSSCEFKSWTVVDLRSSTSDRVI
ncbi:MAG: hypothetical protein ACPGXK_07770, partial [Phycisphaerae bacterium]